MKKIIYIITLCLCVTSCDNNLERDIKFYKEYKESKEKKLKELKNYKIKDFYSKKTIKPKKLNSEYWSLIKAYKKQKNHLSFAKESFSYNGKKFYLKDTPEQIEKVFGEPNYNLKEQEYSYSDKYNLFIKIDYKELVRDFGHEKIKDFTYLYIGNESKVIYRGGIYPNTNQHVRGDCSKLELYDKRQLFSNGINTNYGFANTNYFTNKKASILKKSQDTFKDALIKTTDEIIYKYDAHKMELKFKYDEKKKNYFLEKIHIDLDWQIPYINITKKTTPYSVIKLRGIPYQLDKPYFDFLKLTNLKEKDGHYSQIVLNENFLNSNNCLIHSYIYSNKPSGTPYGLGGTAGYNDHSSSGINKLTFSLKYLNNLIEDEERELKHDIDESKDKIKYYQKKLNQLKNK